MKCCGQFWSLADAIESAQAELAALRGQADRELTVEECDENAPLRNMAPLAVRVPRLPVRPETEAHPSPVPAITATVVGVAIWWWR